MSLLTFREIQRQVQAKIQNTNAGTSSEDDLLPKIRDWINARYIRLYRSFPWQESIETVDKTLTASTITYSLDRDITEILRVFDKTNGKVVDEDTIENHIRESADKLDKVGSVVSDNPTRYRLIGTFPCEAEIGDTGETISVVSTNNTTDIAPNCVHIEGLVGGVLLDEDITLTGTTAATSTYTYDANQKLLISVGTTTGVRKTVVGKITVSGSDSSTVFAKIAPSEYAHMYQWIRVSPTPKAAGTQPTWEIWYKKRLRRLNNDNDIPIISCCDELVQGAFADALREDGLEQEASLAEQQFVTMVKELQASQKSRYSMDMFKPVNRETTVIYSDPYTWTS